MKENVFKFKFDNKISQNLIGRDYRCRDRRNIMGTHLCGINPLYKVEMPPCVVRVELPFQQYNIFQSYPSCENALVSIPA